MTLFQGPGKAFRQQTPGVKPLETEEPKSASALPLELFFFRPQCLQRLFHQFAAYFFFLLRRNVGVADDVNDTVAQYDAVGTDHLCNGEGGRDLNRRYA